MLVTLTFGAMDLPFLNEQELKRYDHQLRLPEIGSEGQKKLKNACVAVVGAGGLGIPIIQYLSASGVGKICIIDYDLILETNIQHQTLYGVNDFGKLKTIFLKSQLEKIFKHITYDIINLKLNTSNCLTLLNQFDLIIDATNNHHVHLLIDDTCLQLNKSFISGSVNGMFAVFSVFNHHYGFFYKDLKEHLSINSSLANDGHFTGSTAVVYGITGSFMALETIRYLINPSNSLFGYAMVMDFIKYQFSKMSLKRSLIENL